MWTVDRKPQVQPLTDADLPERSLGQAVLIIRITSNYGYGPGQDWSVEKALEEAEGQVGDSGGCHLDEDESAYVWVEAYVSDDEEREGLLALCNRMRELERPIEFYACWDSTPPSDDLEEAYPGLFTRF